MAKQKVEVEIEVPEGYEPKVEIELSTHPTTGGGLAREVRVRGNACVIYTKKWRPATIDDLKRCENNDVLARFRDFQHDWELGCLKGWTNGQWEDEDGTSWAHCEVLIDG